ncbi:MAG: hypothetical protein Crog4KO_18010 [Crocinitomicaceae bacterium]
MINATTSNIANTTLYRFGTGQPCKPGDTQVITCAYGDQISTSYATPSVCDNNNSANYSAEVVSWTVKNVSGKGSMVVTVKNTGSTEIYPAVSILFATQG